MKLAITGANGFIGKYLVAEALTQGHNVVAITRQAKETYLANFIAEHKSINIDSLTAKECDLRDAQKLSESLEGCDVVIHLAIAKGGDNQYQQTMSTTQNVIDAINNNHIKSLLLVSSISVLDYGNQTAFSQIDEKTPLCNRDSELGDYARIKRDQEKHCQQWHLTTGKQLIIVRPGLVYSDNQLSDAHAGYIKKGMGITVMHEGEVPLIKVEQVAAEIIEIINHSLFAKELFHLIGKPSVSQEAYLDQLKQQGQIKICLPLPWKLYDKLTTFIRWVLNKIKKEASTPDSFRANSVAARQKPFHFSSDKIDHLTKG